MRDLSQKQVSLLRQVREATDGESDFQRSGAANVKGLCSTGSTILSLERRGLVQSMGFCNEVDGDGFTVRENVPWWTITASGRGALAGFAASLPPNPPFYAAEPVRWTYQGKGILETCQRLHSSLCGTAVPLGELEEQQVVDWLTRRLAAWRKPQGSRWGGFEDAVRKVVEAVLRERETESGWLRARSEGVPR